MAIPQHFSPRTLLSGVPLSLSASPGGVGFEFNWADSSQGSGHQEAQMFQTLSLVFRAASGPAL